MPGEQLSAEGFVLEKGLTGERFLRLGVFSIEHGYMLCLLRQPAKNPQGEQPDLFDRAALQLERPSDDGKNYFVKEYRLLERFPDIGKSYHTLAAASEFVRILSANLVHAERFEPIYELCENALQAFARGARPDAVLCKALYMLAKDEGYAVKEHWWSGLPSPEQEAVATILRTPPEALNVDKRVVERAINTLQSWLRLYTDFVI